VTAPQGDTGHPNAEQTKSVLLIGFGNVSRRDDGVALHILRRLRERLDLPVDDVYADASGNEPLSMIYVHQLAPELSQTTSEYDTVVFIDAHVQGLGWEPVHWRELSPALSASLTAHQLKPESVLALSESLFGHAPRGYVLSVLGHDFDFGQELSPETASLAGHAVQKLYDLLRSEGLIAGG
jgi:hydrogenase maturation protease